MSAKSDYPNFLSMLEQYEKLGKGGQAELRRVSTLSELKNFPAFYRLLQGREGRENMQRLIFCLPYVKHSEEGMKLGQAFSKAKVNERRLFQVVRSGTPNDFIQLRRMLKMIGPITVDWNKVGKQLYLWGDISKRQLLEDFFFYQNSEHVA